VLGEIFGEMEGAENVDLRDWDEDVVEWAEASIGAGVIDGVMIGDETSGGVCDEGVRLDDKVELRSSVGDLDVVDDGTADCPVTRTAVCETSVTVEEDVCNIDD